MDIQELKSIIENELEIQRLHREQLNFELNKVLMEIEESNNTLFKLENQLNIVTNESKVIVSVKDWLSKEDYDKFYPNIQMLFTEEILFRDWLDWFYDELPYIKDKHLSFIGKQTNKSYSILDITGLVKVNKKNQEIYIDSIEPIVIKLGSCNLFKLLSVSYDS